MAKTTEPKPRGEKTVKAPKETASFQVRLGEDAMLAQEQHNRTVIDSVAALADEPFSRFWDNPLDAEYDDL